MADRIKDAEDRLLESIFVSTPIADDGFSDRVVRRIRRHIWIRRLTLPTAMFVGAAIASKPLMQLITVSASLLDVVLQEAITLPAIPLPQLPLILLGGALLVIAMLTVRMLEE
ncbi:MAG: hypothetical protein OEO82_11590 [Gammaproteobacteria bacterium]|nr:hypothetical protein [Gammaproteobacteria bacterium]